MSRAHLARIRSPFKTCSVESPQRIQNHSGGFLQCSQSPPWHTKVFNSKGAFSSLTRIAFQSGALKSGSSLGGRLLDSSLQRQPSIVRKRTYINAQSVEDNYAGFADVFVKNHFFQDKEVVTLPMPLVYANFEETEGIVLDVLEAFHEDTEPWFFSEYKDPVSFKTVDSVRDEGENEDGENGIPPPLQTGNKNLMELFWKLDEPDRKEFLMAQAVLSVEAQVAATMAAEAEKKRRKAPSDPDRFRTFGTNEGDIYFPKFFEGSWDVDSVVVCLDVPGGIDKQSEMVLKHIHPQIDHHRKQVFRFMNHKGKVIDDGLHNNMSTNGNMISHGCYWDPDHPGQLLVENVCSDEKTGVQKVNEVSLNSLLSFDTPERGVFDLSKFFREVVHFETVKGLQVKGTFCRERYKWDPYEESPNEIKGLIAMSTFDIFLENNYLVNTVIDKDLVMHVLSKTQRPTFISKAVVRMRRRTEPNTE